MFIPLALVFFVACIVVAHRIRPHITDAVLAPLVGVFLAGSILGIVVLMFRIIRWESFQSIGLGLILLVMMLALTALPLWGIAYLPLRRMAPLIADVASPIEPEVVGPWLAAGCSEPVVMRSRPNSKRAIYALRGPEPGQHVYLPILDGRRRPMIVSAISSGALVTTDSSVLMLDYHELRQITRAHDPAELLLVHNDGITFLAELGMHNTSSQSALEVAMNRIDTYRSTVTRRPWRVVTTLMRAPFHLGPLRTRPGRRWQPSRLNASE